MMDDVSADAASWSREARRRAEQVLPDFAQKLDSFAAELTDPEREMLGRLLFQAMGPLDRMRLANSGGLLTEHEREVLRSLSEAGEE